MSEINISYFKSIIDQDRAAVVICNLNHEIIYMNPAAVVNYGKRGGDKLIGRSLLECHNKESQEKIRQVTEWFAQDESHNIVYTFHNEKQNKDVYMVALRDSGKLIGYYEKHEYRDRETMKMYDLWGVPTNEEVIKNFVDCFLCKTNVHVRYQRYLDDCYWPDSGRYAL